MKKMPVASSGFMATKKTTKPGRPSRKYIAVTAYLAFDPDAKLKDMMSCSKSFLKRLEKEESKNGQSNYSVTFSMKKSDGPYPKKVAKLAVSKKKAPANKNGKIKRSKKSS